MKPALALLLVLLASAFLPWVALAAEEEAPPAPAEPPKRSFSRASEEQRQRYANLSEGAKAQLRERLAGAREKLMESTPDERKAYIDKLFDKIEAEDKEGKIKQPAPDGGPQGNPPAATVSAVIPPVISLTPEEKRLRIQSHLHEGYPIPPPLEPTKPSNPPQMPETTEKNLPELVAAFIQKPEDTHQILKLAALQVWFGKEADAAATIERVIKWANSATLKPDDMERVAKLMCLRPIDAPATKEAALILARKAVELGDGDRVLLPWARMTLGMAEYRNGHYAEAENALKQKERSLSTDGLTARFYLATTYFQQGKKTEAHDLFVATEKVMKPLPNDEKNPLSEGNHDDLVLWLAYKEARALLKETGEAKNMKTILEADAKAQVLRDRYAKLSEGAKTKYQAAAVDHLTTLMKANPEERQAFVEKWLAELEAGDRAGKFKDPPSPPKLAADATEKTLPELVAASLQKPEDTDQALKLAALQAWLGKETDYTATLDRMLDWGSSAATRQEDMRRVVELTCLRPIDTPAAQEAVLNLARKAAGPGKKPWLPAATALGMAEYRNGHYAEAENALKQKERSLLTDGLTARFYLAMTYFQQGKKTEAHDLFVSTEPYMRPLPDDERNPLTHGNHEDLICWLAHKEAQALLNEPDATERVKGFQKSFVRWMEDRNREARLSVPARINLRDRSKAAQEELKNASGEELAAHAEKLLQEAEAEDLQRRAKSP